MLPTTVQTVWRIPWTSWDPPLVSPQTRASMLSRGSPGHPRILPWCPLRHGPPCCQEDPLDIPGSSLGVPSDTVPHAVCRIPWTSWDPPLASRPPCCPEDPLDIPGSSLGVPLDTGPHAVWRILWTSQVLPWCPFRHRPPCCPEDSLENLGSSLGVPSDTGPHAVRMISWSSQDPPLVSSQIWAPLLSGGSPGHPGILLWCFLTHGPPCCPEDPLDIPGSSFGVSSDTGPHAVRRIPRTSQDPPLVSF